MAIQYEQAKQWMESLKKAWEDGDPKSAVNLFTHTSHYYERPFNPGTTQDEIKLYWKDIVGLQNITFDYEIVAIEGSRLVVHWQNGFTHEGSASLLDGVFFIDFDDNANCVEFRQWWFARD
jgi:hypothetical protein